MQQVGAAPADIFIFDAIRNVPFTIYYRGSKEFPGVHFVDGSDTDGREKAVVDIIQADGLRQGRRALRSATVLTQADYMINVAGLKGTPWRA